jgi:hypothetical protein
MFSTEWFSNDEKARKYYCGLKTNCFNWLMDSFMPEVTQFFSASGWWSFVFSTLLPSMF